MCKTNFFYPEKCAHFFCFFLNFLKYHQIYWCPFMKLSFFYKFLTLIDRNPEIPSLFTQLLLNFPIWKHNWSSECLPGGKLGIFHNFLNPKRIQCVLLKFVFATTHETRQMEEDFTIVKKNCYDTRPKLSLKQMEEDFAIFLLSPFLIFLH